MPQLIEATPEDEILCHDLYDRDPSSAWGSGRITLLGDAAHPMTPFMGQGGCQAIEDSVALAAALKGGGDVPAALRDYERGRMDRTAGFVLQSRKAQSISMMTNPFACALRDLALGMAPKRLLVRELHTLSRYQLPSLS